MLRLLSSLMAVAQRAAIALSELARLPLGAPERLDWERETLSAHHAGDHSAFANLYRAYAPLVYARVLLPLLKQPELAKDALADTFEKARPKLRGFTASDRSIYFWFARIGKNLGLDIHRRTLMRRGHAPALKSHMERLQLPDPDPESTLSALEQSTELRRRVDEVLAALSPRYRKAIELRFFEDRSRPDCAQALEVKLATFDVVLLRALRAFRARWQEASQ